mmetsp:Transcript_3931/g.10129  ORF Transcript_3931/g.10129 Transcript_3931/m.10129 type:complete len:211 (-) Transcript_3931:502-1134(-)
MRWHSPRLIVTPSSPVEKFSLTRCRSSRMRRFSAGSVSASKRRAVYSRAMRLASASSSFSTARMSAPGWLARHRRMSSAMKGSQMYAISATSSPYGQHGHIGRSPHQCSRQPLMSDTVVLAPTSSSCPRVGLLFSRMTIVWPSISAPRPWPSMAPLLPTIAQLSHIWECEGSERGSFRQSSMDRFNLMRRRCSTYVPCRRISATVIPGGS